MTEHTTPHTEGNADVEVLFGRKWAPARITQSRWNGEVRAVVPSSGTTREMTFRPAEVRPIPLDSNGATRG